MKFEYDVKEEALECVAYVSKWGLVYKDNDTCITIFDDGSGVDVNSYWDEGDAIHKFYPGDKITITF